MIMLTKFMEEKISHFSYIPLQRVNIYIEFESSYFSAILITRQEICFPSMMGFPINPYMEGFVNPGFCYNLSRQLTPTNLYPRS
jgi:hypothetical protein